MPEYIFEAEDGDQITRYYPFDKAPRVGKAVWHKKKKYTRVLSCLASEITYGVAPEYSFVSHQVDPDQAPHIDPKTGSGAFRSKAEVKRWCDQSQANEEKGGISFNLEGRKTRTDRDEQVKEQRQARRERMAIKKLLEG